MSAAFTLPEAWNLAKQFYKLTGDLDQTRATFFPPSEVWCLPAPSSIKPKGERKREREFVADSGASMNMLSRKDFNSAELEIVDKKRSGPSSRRVGVSSASLCPREDDDQFVKKLIASGMSCRAEAARSKRVWTARPTKCGGVRAKVWCLRYMPFFRG